MSLVGRLQLVALAFAVGACSERAARAPELQSVTPSSAENAVETPIQIRGENFLPLVRASFDDDQQSTVNVGFAATLVSVGAQNGPHDLGNVEMVTSETLAAVVPAGLPPATYDLVVVDPRERRARLQAAFEVISTAADGGVPDIPPDAPDAMQADVTEPDMTGADAIPTDVTATDLTPVDVQPDAACPPSCQNGCIGGTCLIDCSADDCSCPSGQDCEVSCQGGSCLGNIDCSQATSCNIDCGGDACTGNITCQGSCTLACDGGSCEGNITCGGVCAITCSGGSCKGNITCAGQCQIDCKDNSCVGDVTCSGGPCTIECSSSACQSVDCSTACACSATCSSGSCTSGLSCPPGCDQPNACTDLPAAQCDSC